MSLLIGTYVTHSKLPELGSGEVVSVDQGRISIRFASGDRNFMYALVEPHLTTTSTAPVFAPRTGKRKKA